MDTPEQGMLDRLTSIAAGGMEPTSYDLNFYTHELDEAGRYAELGFGPESGVDLGSSEMYEVWNDVHTVALEDLDARQIDLRVSSSRPESQFQVGPGERTVLRELEALQRLGLVVRDDSRSGVGGRWKATETARPYIS